MIATATLTPDRSATLSEMYRSIFKQPYPKFHKMDLLCKVSLLCVRKLMNETGTDTLGQTDILAFTKDGCLVSDMAHAGMITEGERLASPAVFVYTLPNILTGELAIYLHSLGATELYCVDSLQSDMIDKTVKMRMKTTKCDTMLVITANALDESDFFVKSQLYRR